MILTDREIEIALENKQIIVDPPPNQKAFSSTTLDLTLASGLEEWAEMIGVTISPGASNYSFAALSRFRNRLTTPYELKPQKFVLAWTREEITLPHRSRIAARVEGKSSLARLGVGIHVTAPTIHSGFSGNVQLEVFNSGQTPSCLRKACTSANSSSNRPMARRSKATMACSSVRSRRRS